MAKSGAKEDELQAVLIADNFDKRFLPLDVPLVSKIDTALF